MPGGYPPSNHGPSVGGGGGTVVGDGDTLKGVQETPARGTLTPGVGVETPRRVMFGAPMAAEFNHTSPSNKLTPMPSRDAKVCCFFVVFFGGGGMGGEQRGKRLAVFFFNVIISCHLFVRQGQIFLRKLPYRLAPGNQRKPESAGYQFFWL